MATRAVLSWGCTLPLSSRTLWTVSPRARTACYSSLPSLDRAYSTCLPPGVACLGSALIRKHGHATPSFPSTPYRPCLPCCVLGLCSRPMDWRGVVPSTAGWTTCSTVGKSEWERLTCNGCSQFLFVCIVFRIAIEWVVFGIAWPSTRLFPR